MAEPGIKDYQDFLVEVEEGEGSSSKYVLRVGVKRNEKDAATKWLKQGFNSCVSQTKRVVNNVKESHSKTKGGPTSPTKSEPGINWNGVVDFAIQLAVKELIKTGSKGDLPLPDIVPPPEPPSFFETRLTATGGNLRDVTTLERHGDATASKKGSDVTLVCAVGLRELTVSYNHYQARMCGCSLVGGMSLGVASNSVSGRVTLRVRKGGECHVTLSEVKVARLGGVRVKLTGLGPLNWLASKLAAWRVRKMNDVIAAQIEEMVTSHVTQVLEGLRCDDFVVMLTT